MKSRTQPTPKTKQAKKKSKGPILINILNNQLFKAAENADVEKVAVLLGKGADANAKNDVGIPILSEAVFSLNEGNEKVVEILIASGARVDTKTRDGRTALSIAAWGGDEKAVSILIKAGAKVNTKDRSRYTPLMWAIFTGSSHVIPILIEAGANLYATDKYCDTALEKASHEKQSTAAFLIARAMGSEELEKSPSTDFHWWLVPLIHSMENKKLKGLKTQPEWQEKVAEELILKGDLPEKDRQDILEAIYHGLSPATFTKILKQEI